MLEKKILETITERNLIKKNEHIIVGLSGGPDSVCLFDVLEELAYKEGWHIHVVHVNHKFRPGAAEEDQAYVEKMCLDAGVDCRVYEYDCAAIAASQGISSEEAGRNARYEAFSRRAKEIALENDVSMENVKIAVAHNYNDQAETVLIRIIRGAGTDGLAGMEYIRQNPDGSYTIRPLLDITREEIEKHCADRDLQPKTDQTNKQAIYTRNKVRLQLIPYIKEIFGTDITDGLNRLARIAREDSRLLKTMAETAMEDIIVTEEKEKVELDLNKLKKLDQAIMFRVIMKALKDTGLMQDMTAAHFAAAADLIFNGQPSKHLDLPEGYFLRTGYDTVVIGKSSGDADEDMMIKTRIRREEMLKRISMKVSIEAVGENPPVKTRTRAIFDWDLLNRQYRGELEPSDITLRTRKAGDWLSLGDGKGKKKLKEYFIDAKVPKEDRDWIPVIAAGSEILWVAGEFARYGVGEEKKPRSGINPIRIKNRYSGSNKYTRDTKNALIIELLGEI